MRIQIDIIRALDMFVVYPADTDYRRGWLACLLSILPGDDHPYLEQLKEQLK